MTTPTSLYGYMSAIRSALQTAVPAVKAAHSQIGAPRLVTTPEKGLPILCVYSTSGVPEPLDTVGETYWEDQLVVAWYTSVMDALETGIIKEADAQAHLDTAAAIESAMLSWVPSIPQTVGQHEAAVTNVRRGRVRGGVLGTEITLALRRVRP